MDKEDIKKIDPEAFYIVEKLINHGYLAYYAGGWVRDYVLGHPSQDIDIATTATPAEIEAIFSHTTPIGAAFGIILVIVKGKPFEVATFRRDGPYLDGRFPISIEHTDPKEDAFRRDFTINGMFFDPIQCNIIDYVGGKEDLEKGIIRAIGTPMNRFDEDRLRMIRAVRFSHRFGFSIEEETKKAIRHYSHTLFPSVSIERVWAELDKMGQEVNFHYALIEMESLGLLKVILPHLDYRNIGELELLLEPLDTFPPNCPTILKILPLYLDSPSEYWENLGIYFKLSRKNIRHIENFFKLYRLITQEETPSSYEWVGIYALEEIDLYLNCAAAFYPESEAKAFLKEHTAQQNKLSEHIQRRRMKKYLVDSLILQKEGVPKGPLMGSLIREGEKITINKNLDDSEKVLSLLRKNALWPKEMP